MSNPKDRANDPNRKSVHDHTDAELLEKFNQIHAHVLAQPQTKRNPKGYFADDPSSRNTGWFFHGKP